MAKELKEMLNIIIEDIGRIEGNLNDFKEYVEKRFDTLESEIRIVKFMNETTERRTV